MSDLKRISSTDARPTSLKHMLLKVAVRCAELESDFRELEAEVRTKKSIKLKIKRQTLCWRKLTKKIIQMLWEKSATRVLCFQNFLKGARAD